MNRFFRGVLIASTLGVAVTVGPQPQAVAAMPSGIHEPGVNGAVGADCMFKGKKMWGKFQVVTSFPDVKVKKVDSFPDLKVKAVTSFPDACGKWQMVDSFPDVKIQYVDSFPDIKVKFVDSFPGL